MYPYYLVSMMCTYVECPIPLTVPKVCPSCGANGKMDIYKRGEAKRIVVVMSD